LRKDEIRNDYCICYMLCQGEKGIKMKIFISILQRGTGIKRGCPSMLTHVIRAIHVVAILWFFIQDSILCSVGHLVPFLAAVEWWYMSSHCMHSEAGLELVSKPNEGSGVGHASPCPEPALDPWLLPVI
jgi:hypothetical protein